MEHITIADPLSRQFTGVGHLVEMVDASGSSLGVFVPSKLNRLRGQTEAEPDWKTLERELPKYEFERLVCDWMNAQVSDEELERLRSEGGERTLDQILARLEAI